MIVVHVIAWSVYLLLYSTLWREGHKTFAESLILNLALLPPKLFLVYTTLQLLIPRLLLRKRYALFFCSLVAMSFVGGIFNQVMVHFIIPAGMTGIRPDENFWDLTRISKRLTYINSTLLFALTAEGIRMWYEQKEANDTLLKEKMTAQLSMLRSQLQPHFFFNTLNNLYSLTLRKSDLAPQMILQMSDMMRYILSSSHLDRVQLKDEVNFVKDYIGIEAIRYSGKVTVTTTWPDQLDNHRVPPLSLFPFVENAFKHGVAEAVGSAWVDVVLNVDKGALSFTVRNSYLPQSQSNRSGIGLSNTKERLSIEYGDNLVFNTRQSEDSFEATLIIKQPTI